MASGQQDDRLLEELRAAVRNAGTPTPGMIAAAQEAFALRKSDVPVATRLDEPASSGSATGATEAMVFATGDATLELERSGAGLRGRLGPPAPGEVTLLGPAGRRVRADVDATGSFVIALPRSGPIRLHCRTSRALLLTDWFTC